MEILLRLAQLVSRHPRIQELDINPFLAVPGGRSAALDVRVRVAPVEGAVSEPPTETPSSRMAS